MATTLSPRHETVLPDDAAQPPASTPLYVAGLIITICGLYAINIILGDSAFGNLTIGLATAGWLVSFISRKQNVAPRAIEMPAAVLCVFLAFTALISDQVLPFLSPPGISDDRAKSLAVLLTWLVVFRSFTLITDGSLLFCCVPTIAMIGLAGTMTADSALVTSFMVFGCAAAFMLVHENFLRTRRALPGPRQSAAERTLFANQLQVSAVCAIGALALANLVVEPMRVVGSNIVLNPAMIRQAARMAEVSTTPILQVAERPELTVGAGPANASQQVVMTVRAEFGTFWRGTTFNEYTGNGWRNTSSESQPMSPDSALQAGDDILADPNGNSALFTYRLPSNQITATGSGSQTLLQHVSLSGTSRFNAIYAAGECRRLEIGEPMIRVDRVGTVSLERDVQGIQYTVRSEVPDSSPERLTAARGDIPAAIRENYLEREAPTARMRQIRESAERVTQGLKNQYDRVVALQQWVSSECKYNLQTPAIPIGQDVATYFLYTSKEGACTEFATALTLLCRSIGIPARVASGFNAGTMDRETQEYLVRERDKHAWTEVYFPGVGWTPFDATTDAEDISVRESERVTRKGGLVALLFSRGWLPPMTLLVILGMFAYVLKVEIMDRMRRRRPITNPLGIPATNLEIVEAYGAACKVLARLGLPRAVNSTPTEYSSEVEIRTNGLGVATAFAEISDLLIRFRYGRETATEIHVRQAHEALESMRKALRMAGKRAIAPIEPAPAPALSEA